MQSTETLRESTFSLIARSYSEIGPNAACEFVALDEARLFQEAQARGWSFDENTKTLKPVVSKTAATAGARRGGSDMPDRMQKLTDILIQLEK